MGTFADWQPAYAEAGIATFPVRDKRPAVKGYMRAGLGASRRFALKFPDAEQFGFACRPSRITVLDIDDPDEKLLDDALAEYGETPIIVRSGSGNHQAWYRHNGEGRKIRADPSKPIDILDDGYVVAPPSSGRNTPYELIRGSLADLSALPCMRRGAAPAGALPVQAEDPAGLIPIGYRNDSLWRACMGKVRACGTEGELLDFAMHLNRTELVQALPDGEVRRTVASAWEKELTGDNWFGSGKRIVVPHELVDTLLQDNPDAFILLTILRRHHWGRDFVVANAMAEAMPPHGWRRERFVKARNWLVDSGEIVRLAPAGSSRPARFCFKGAQN